MVESWTMKGATFGPCNCDWGCPCNFDAPPTYGHCDGIYVWAVREGTYGAVSLDGLSFAWAAHSPGPIHEGGLTAIVLVDEQASASQRDALAALWTGGPAGLPFDILNAVTSKFLGTIYAQFEIELAGINTKAKIDGGKIFEVEQSRVRNPVTGEEEELHLDKPKGFTSTRSELGVAEVARFATDGLVLEGMNGKYAEYAEFEYAGP
jgi:hypothetical protein